MSRQIETKSFRQAIKSFNVPDHIFILIKDFLGQFVALTTTLAISKMIVSLVSLSRNLFFIRSQHVFIFFCIILTCGYLSQESPPRSNIMWPNSTFKDVSCVIPIPLNLKLDSLVEKGRSSLILKPLPWKKFDLWLYLIWKKFSLNLVCRTQSCLLILNVTRKP